MVNNKTQKRLNDDYEDELEFLGLTTSTQQRIISRKAEQTEHFYPLDYELDDFKDSDGLIKLLASAHQGDTIIIFINSRGGSLEVADLIVNRIHEARARGVIVIAELGFTVASAATYISLACDDWVVSDSCNYLIHGWSSGAYPDFAENIYANAAFNKRQSDAFLHRVYKNFLTEDEIEDLIKHPRDLQFDAYEIKARWINKVTIESGDGNEEPQLDLKDVIKSILLEIEEEKVDKVTAKPRKKVTKPH